jgi:hypothetical protein
MNGTNSYIRQCVVRYKTPLVPHYISLLFHPEDGGSIFLSNVYKLLPTTCHMTESTATFFAILDTSHPKNIHSGA